jgi:catechol 2,3-dioxygenase-like lactoylglutathione lyase family enzyme
MISNEQEAAMTTDAPKVHVHMKVSSLEKSRAFYEKFLGTPPVKVKPGYLKFLAPLGPLNLALSEAAPVDGRGHVDHMGLQVETADVVRRELARVKAAGLPVREEMGVNCCHANQDKFWVEDPDGVEWEVYVLNHDIEDETAGCATTQPKSSFAVVTGATSCCAPAR